MKKVVLIGYMGSGKSVVAQKLGDKTKISVVELDDLIEKECGMSITEIFDSKGELFFRKKEHELFKNLLNSKENLIVSTGGGTPCYYNNHELLENEEITSIYLKASIETLYKRLVHEKQKRPLLADLSESETKDFIAKHLFDRSFYYHKATYKINVDDKSVNEIVDEIADLLA